MGTSALIAYIDENDQESRDVFTSFAESHPNEFIYGMTTDLTLAKTDVQKTPFIVLYNPLDQVNPTFQESFDDSKIEAFTKKYSTPLIGTFSLETYFAYSKVPLLYFPLSPSSQLTLRKVRQTACPHLRLLPLLTLNPPLRPQTRRRKVQRKAKPRNHRCNEICLLCETLESCS
jgi:hypothetical protein